MPGGGGFSTDSGARPRRRANSLAVRRNVSASCCSSGSRSFSSWVSLHRKPPQPQEQQQQQQCRSGEGAMSRQALGRSTPASPQRPVCGRRDSLGLAIVLVCELSVMRLQCGILLPRLRDAALGLHSKGRGAAKKGWGGAVRRAGQPGERRSQSRGSARAFLYAACTSCSFFLHSAWQRCSLSSSWAQRAVAYSSRCWMTAGHSGGEVRPCWTVHHAPAQAARRRRRGKAHAPGKLTELDRCQGAAEGHFGGVGRQGQLHRTRSRRGR
jgi:hypothetical protein